ncbi:MULTISPECIES: glycerophosphodiester phosphodiesterase [Rhizobium]|uniref:Glycerophosphodiester phosphodiesterase n=1 Tax=Rhizobium tropici TaxID=398 RepID=A0A6P1CC89_RHITR|nr:MULTISPECIES: glycerophosphodiester phosphodiesterase [Rhizobium]AGB71083.1 glycerophosphoryl diester phosphodiesterase [Rhizobium tropici CIAT 899]MBB4242327.1 glycerophosphoryl diester phosphodiesterase [Rhizobium tropici]MBB5593970.1 glycerophosphoryl diester phosphodiesterase [Rhizobium tropici]MBB6492909.1 glycerophosphoryl diester phosphodiesterase [Rhizobium tropici]NEV13303.1 glycerophosphodiester phosphodiesterase [Rhizobium tropici]
MSKFAWLTERPVAHRGYHDMNKEVWENTLSAFSRAIEAGFAIECDLHYASDGVPVVFHDDDLQRVCNLPAEVRELTSAELGLLSIGGTKDKIPTLKQLLQLCGGKVPLVLELKGREGDDEGFAESVLEVLEGYKGHVALMSFDHWLLKDLKSLEAPYPVGLTAEGNKPETFFQHDEAMHLGLDFISYFYGHLPNPFVTAQRQRGIPVITWTVRDEAARKHTFANADQMTFEGFDPRQAS